jgi:hypothetical protein
MKKKIIIFLLVICLGSVFYFIFIKKDKIEPEQISIENIQKAEFVEEYIDFVYDENANPILFKNINKVESDILIKKLEEFNLKPENVLKVGNELYFVSKIVKDEETEGTALFLYDVIMRKFKELYFYKKEEFNYDIKFVFQAIDVVGNKLVVVLQSKDLACGSLWLEQRDSFYTFDLLDNGKDGLVKYDIPGWKINEEKEKNFDCE